MNALAFWRRYALAYAEFLGSLLAPLVAALVTETAARLLPRPPAPPAPEQRATGHASQLAGRLWDRYRDPWGAPDLSPARRPDAILIAAALDTETVGWLAHQIQCEYQDGPDAPPLSHEVNR